MTEKKSDVLPQKIIFYSPASNINSGSISSRPNKSPLPTTARRKQTPSQKSKKNLQLDILALHEQILDKLEAEFEQLEFFKQQVEKLQWISTHSDNPSEKNLATVELHKLETKVKLIETGYREAKYIYDTESILAEYIELMKQPIKVDFMGNKIFDQQPRKQVIIREFLNIAKDYISVPTITNQQQSLICADCQIDLQLEDDFLFICPNCGNAIKHFTSTSSYQENTRINVSQRYVYDKRAHFGDSIKKYQAKQNTTIAPQVYSDLWDKVNSHDIPIDRLTKDHIYEFLKLTGHSDHYEDITLIYCEMTKKSPPDISFLENELFALFDKIAPIYERVKPINRVNFLNGQFVLFKLLQKLKFPCREEDFYILKTRDKMLEHDEIWERICQDLQWTFIPTV